LEIGKENFEKGKSESRVIMQFRSHKPVDLIILAQENLAHPLPRNPGGLAQGII
jgi:hypothetical protein